MSATALWFGPEERRLFGWLNLPEGARPTQAVVLCPPVGLELQNAYYGLRLLAEELEASGLAVVRFDYDGTGDSAGDAQDLDRIESWVRSIELAAALARSHGATSISLVGIRLGSLLAEFAASRISDLEAMVLWDPYVTARGFVRHQRALERLRLASAPETAPYSGAPGGWVDAPTLDALKQLEAPPARTDASPHTLVLHRPEDGTIASLLPRLDPTRTEVLAVDGQREFLDAYPPRRVIPRATITYISSWLATTLAPESADRCQELADTTPETAASGRQQLWQTVDVAAVMVAQSGFGPISERIVKLGDVGLFGIETMAENTDPALPAIVLLSSSRDRHIGPHRIWVRWARHWAALGFRCVRFDPSGLADSPVRPGQLPDICRAPEAFDDLSDVVNAISPADPTNVVLVGLCSSGYQAFDSGLALMPRGILAVNPEFTFRPPETAHGPIDPRRQVCLSTTSTTVRAYKKYVPSWLRSPLQPLAWRARRLVAPGKSGSRWVKVLVDQGVNAYCICGPGDVYQLPLAARQSLPPSDSGGSFRVQILENLEHALAPPPDQERVATLFTDYLLENFRPGTLHPALIVGRCRSQLPAESNGPACEFTNGPQDRHPPVDQGLGSISVEAAQLSQ